ncbi:MAG: hypothetical protein ACF8QF_04615 [Phycisphaerales bacterium]
MASTTERRSDELGPPARDERAQGERAQEERVGRPMTSREGSAIEWNGQSGVREFRVDATARPDSRNPSATPRRICIGEVCEPLS